MWVGRARYEIGSASFLNSFFSTIYVRLENEDWGSRYPLVMGPFYEGKLAASDSVSAQAELEAIRAALARHPPQDVVWDYEDRAAAPPWGANISAHITSLANYFVTSDGKDLIGVLGAAFRDAAQTRHDVVIGE